MENVYIIFWAVLAALAFVGELLSVSFFLLFFSLGALVGLLLAALGAGVVAQVVGFIGASVLSMLVLRPTLLHRISSRTSERYVGPGSITGKSGVITTAIEPGGSGTVRIGSGEFWSARALYPDQGLETGTRVRVLDTDGVTALVEALGLEEGEKS
ncbi:MAG TPA: NfeD family protein [Rubrobacteraceae bacterium]|nr:NfeD family protein [Rubrobacteraceae bacterium]